MKVILCDAPDCAKHATVRITVEALNRLYIVAGQPTRERSVDCCDEHAEQFRISDDPQLIRPRRTA